MPRAGTFDVFGFKRFGRCLVICCGGWRWSWDTQGVYPGIYTGRQRRQWRSLAASIFYFCLVNIRTCMDVWLEKRAAAAGSSSNLGGSIIVLWPDALYPQILEEWRARRSGKFVTCETTEQTWTLLQRLHLIRPHGHRLLDTLREAPRAV